MLTIAQISNRVAIKKLIDPDKDDFKKEDTILRQLAPKKHPHLLQLLATYEQTTCTEGVKYHFIFPLADDNLRDYWDKRMPNPEFDKPTVFWAINQMTGITGGLLQVHVHTVSISLGSKDGETMSVKPGEEWFGRHGDIKPENILWFSEDSEYRDGRGVLKLGDFGLGRFHGLESRSKVPPGTISGTITYEPPELKLRIPVSRAYDIWSLGCLFLEFATWLLKGANAVNDFADARAESNPSTPKMTDDSFFTVTQDMSSADVREGVKKWVRGLHQHPRCSQLIHDLLNLVMKEMLVVERDKRKEATMLHNTFLEFTTKAGKNMAYALQPVPWPAGVEPLKVSAPTAGLSVSPVRRTMTVFF
jgi:serine/threonine protein kinase